MLAFLTDRTVAWWTDTLQATRVVTVSATGDFLLPIPVRVRQESAAEVIEALTTEGYFPPDLFAGRDWQFGCLGCASDRDPGGPASDGCTRETGDHPYYVPEFRSIPEVLAFASRDPANLLQAAEHVALVQRTYRHELHPVIRWAPRTILQLDAMAKQAIYRSSSARHLAPLDLSADRPIHQSDDVTVRLDGRVLREGGLRGAAWDASLQWLWCHGFHLRYLADRFTSLRYYTPFREFSR